MNRRRFTGLSTFALAAAGVSAFAQAGAGELTPRRVGIAPVGLGSTAEVFMGAVTKTPNARLTGLVTGHPAEKGAKFAAQYGVPQSSIYTYESFDRSATIAPLTRCTLRCRTACTRSLRCARRRRGKHVFCEKPMAISSAECRRMIDACRRAGVLLMIGYRTHFDATFRRVRELVRSGAFGEIEAFQGGFYGMKNKQQWRLDRALAGGGSLLDLGIYRLNAMRWMTGEEPSEVRAFVAMREKGPKFASVEQSMDWLLKFPSGVLASGGSSYGQSGTNFLQINGSAGHVRIEPASLYGDAVLTLTGVDASGDAITGGGPVTLRTSL